MKRIISIIGGGIGGLAAGCRLAAQGHRVTIYERNTQPGGKAAGIRIENLWVDSTPTILRMPHLVKDLFLSAAGNDIHHLDLKLLDPHYRFFQAASDNWFEIASRSQATKTSISSVSSTDAEHYDEFLDFCQHTYTNHLSSNPVLPTTFNINSIFKRLSSGSSMAAPFTQPYYRMIASHFKHPLIRHSFGYFPLFFGQNPFTAPASYAMLHSIEQKWGIAYPMGGMRHLVHLLVELFQSLGGTIALNTPVAAIDIHHKTIKNIRLSSGDLLQTDYVISDLSPYQTIQNLILRQPKIEKTPNTKSFGNSHVIMHFICKKLAFRDKIQHHNFILTDTFNQSIQSLFRRNVMPASLNLYVCVPTVTDSTLLPPDQDLVIVVMPAPNLLSLIEWGDESLPVQTLITKTIDQQFPGFQQSIIHQKLTHPGNLAENYGMEWGSNMVPQKHQPIEKLFYTGENAWQGLGLIGIFSSAEAISRTIAKLES